MKNLRRDAAEGNKRISERRDLSIEDLAGILEELRACEGNQSGQYDIAKLLYYAGFACGYRQANAELKNRENV